MPRPRLRHNVEFRAYRDCAVGDFNSVREFSEAITCQANITPVSSSRYVGNVADFGQDRAVSHNAEVRRMDLDVYTEIRHGCDVYRIISQQQSPDSKYMTLGLSIQRRDGADTNDRAVFVNG